MVSKFGNNLFISIDSKLIVRAWKDQQLKNDEDFAFTLRPKELSLQTTFSRFSIKAGYQTIVWGEMDSVTLTDVMTPWDYSEFAFTTPELFTD